MKKIFYLTVMSALVITSLNACQKEKKTSHANDDEENEYVSPITIDGKYDDWAALDASKVAVTSLVAGQKFDVLKKVKVYCDEVYLNVYLEFDITKVDMKSDTGLPFHIYLNSDNSDATGGYAAEFADPNADYCLEASLIPWSDHDGNYQSYDPSIFKWWGLPGNDPNYVDGWLWTEPGIEHSDADLWGALQAGGCGEGAGTLDGKYEIHVSIEQTPINLSDTFTIGFDIQQNWTSVGFLPAAAVTEENPNGLANKLVVRIDKSLE